MGTTRAAIQRDETCLLVHVSVPGPFAGLLLSHLGSLTERYGMCMHPPGPLAAKEARERVAISVPRARSRHDAEEAVTALLEQIARTAD